MKNTMITTYWDVGSKFFTFHKFFLEVLQTVGFLHAVLDVRVKVRLKLQTTSNEKIKFSVLITKDTYMWPASKTVQTNGGHKSSPPAPQAVLNFEQNWKKCVLGGGRGGGGKEGKIARVCKFWVTHPAPNGSVNIDSLWQYNEKSYSSCEVKCKMVSFHYVKYCNMLTTSVLLTFNRPWC